MKVLVIGGGGREHALVWKLKQSPHVDKIWCVPGNGGTESETECLPAAPAKMAEMVGMGERIRPHAPVVGAELPLVNRIRDAFSGGRQATVGPSPTCRQR